MLSIDHIWQVPHHILNEPKGVVWSQMGPSMYNFTSLEKVRSVGFHV